MSGRHRGGGIAAAPILRLLGDFLHGIAFHNIALFDIVEFFNGQAALVAAGHFLRRVLESLEGTQHALVNDDAVPDQADGAVADDLAVLDVAARHGAHAGDLVGLADLRVTQQSLPVLGGQHTLHGGSDFVNAVVDNPVHPHIHVLPHRAIPGRRVRPDIESHDDGAGGGGQHHVGLVHRAHAAVDDPDVYFLVGELFQRCLHGLHAALDVGLDNECQLLALAGLDLVEQVLQADLLHGGGGFCPLLGLALFHQLPGHPLVADGEEGTSPFFAVSDERMARELVEQRKAEERAKAAAPVQKVSLENLFDQIQAGERKELALIVKADVQGSVEAVKASLEKLSNEEVNVRVIHGGVGAVNESDVMLASSSGAIIVGFNVRPDAAARDGAVRQNVDMRMYRVIYDCIDEITAAMKGMLAPKYREALLGHAEVRQTYKVSGVGTVAGCYVQDGKIVRNCSIRLVRDGIVIHEGVLGSLQRFKDAAKEVASGYECGLTIEKFNDIKEGDIVEGYTMEEIPQ